MRYCIRVTVVTINGNAYWRFFNGQWSTNKSNGFPVAGFAKKDEDIKYYPTRESAKDDASRMEMFEEAMKVEIVEESKRLGGE